MKHLIVEVVEVRGRCVANYNIGDRFEINQNVCVEGDKICYFALSSIMPAILALQLGSEPKEIGLSKEKVFHTCNVLIPENLLLLELLLFLKLTINFNKIIV